MNSLKIVIDYPFIDVCLSLGMHSFIEHLRTRLQDSLPGYEAQQKMQPIPSDQLGSYNRPEAPQSVTYRNSSVLVPILMWPQEPALLFTVRTAGIKHGGQISFPGGGQEGNESHEETAIREAHEEVGLHPDNVEVIGRLSPLYVDHSNNLVTPVVSLILKEQTFTANPNEVDQIFDVPFSLLASDSTRVTEEWDLRKRLYTVPFYDVHQVPLWGVTAMLISELVELYREFENG